MDQHRLLHYMCAALAKDFDAVLQLLQGDFEVPICDPPTAALDVSVQLCSGSCWTWPQLLECCDNKFCQGEDRAHGKKLTLLSSACMDGRFTQERQHGAKYKDEKNEQGAVIALLLLAGSDALEGARCFSWSFAASRKMRRPLSSKTLKKPRPRNAIRTTSSYPELALELEHSGH